MSYFFKYLNDSSNSYLFETDSGMFYQIKFKPTPYLFGDEDTEISKYIFEFIIEVIYFDSSKTAIDDKKVGKTVVAIFNDFYEKFGDAITIYICDSSDGKEFIRKRKFDMWFSLYNNETFVKIDEVIVDDNRNSFPISLIISKLNPSRSEIINSFIEIAINNRK